MTTCARCRAEVGDAPYCPRCGQAVLSPQKPVSDEPTTQEPQQPQDPDEPGDWRSDTLERTPVRAPVEPAPAETTPIPARYPLFADEVDDPDHHDEPVTALRAPLPPDPASPEATAVALEPTAYDDDSGRHAREVPMAWLPWALAAVFLLLVAAGGAWLLLAPGDDSTAADTPAAETTKSQATTDPATASTEAAETPSPTPEPSPIETIPVGDPVDVAGQASAQAPTTAPANEDVAGNPVTYVAGNMLDGQPDTSWRMPGDGTGTELTFTLAAPTALTRVGMINGYAKTAVEGGRKLNWYIGNRRVLAATWIFDDGTEVAQPLGATKQMQTIDITAVTTSTVRLRLDAVSAPGTGRSARNYTAVSEVTFVGIPG
jgi:hypothetical protein